MPVHRFILSTAVVFVTIMAAHHATASPQSQPDNSVASAAIAGPVPPEVVSRDAQGQITVRAVRLEQPLIIDGRLDEEIYQKIPGISGFIQQLPRTGEPATERTEVWVLFDTKNLYVVARCYETEPA